MSMNDEIARMMNWMNPKPDKVRPWLYIGEGRLAQSQEVMDAAGIGFILNVCFLENKYSDLYTYSNIQIDDCADEDISAHFDEAFGFLDMVKKRYEADPSAAKGNAFVHCECGISRSSTMVIAYLMHSEGLSLVDAYWQVKKARYQIQPNDGFFNSLRALELRLRGESSCTTLHEMLDIVQRRRTEARDSDSDSDELPMVEDDDPTESSDCGGVYEPGKMHGQRARSGTQLSVGSDCG